MKQITILLSSALTLLLITSNNAYAAPHYSDFSGRTGLQDKNILNQGQIRKGEVFKGSIMMPSNINSGGIPSFNPFQAIAEDQAIMTRPYRLGEDVGNGTPLKRGSSSWIDSGKVEVENSRQNWGYRVNERKFIGENGKDGLHNNGAFRERESGFLNEATLYQNGKDRFIGETGKDGILGQANGYNCKDVSGNCLDKSTPKFGGQEGEAFNPTSKYSISDEPAFIPKPDGALGPDVVTTLEHGPGISGDLRNSNTGTIDPISKEEKPRTSIQLKFIEGAWREVGEPTPLNPATP